jgi:glutamate N-acetyltransferase/amino-acid N-acetyltransferase
MPKAPAGFQLAGVSCGIKSKQGVEDLTLIVSEKPAVAAGVYTQNLVFAAPVAWDRAHTPSDRIRAIVANSGNANACTGKRGLNDAGRMASLAAEVARSDADDVLVLSTGVIGEHLPMEKIAAGVRAASERLGSDEEAFLSAARGIITTDKSHKVAEQTVILASGTRCELVGMAKGAGMIGPRMATMLCIVLTDAPLTPQTAQQSLRNAVDQSFNCISVEGHMSTNDSVLLLASGHAAKSPLSGNDLVAFQNGLNDLCIELARMIPDDGEGASHLVAVDVRGCRSREDAHQIAKTIASSQLVKCAISGGGPYWGRILSAAGYSGVSFDPLRARLSINGICMYENGEPASFDQRAASNSIRQNHETHILLELQEGTAAVRFWTSDLTVDYVRFNTDYFT